MKLQKTPKLTHVEYVALARDGNLEALFSLIDMDNSTSNDREAYKWLTLARDFGHEAADERIDDVIEISSMRYDDSGCERAAAHWELAASYLEGADSMPVDLALAEKHLEFAFENHSLETINAGTNENYSAAILLNRLTGKAKELLSFHLAGGDLQKRVHKRMERVRRLEELKAPEIVIQNEKQRLQDAIRVLEDSFEKTSVLRPHPEPLQCHQVKH